MNMLLSSIFRYQDQSQHVNTDFMLAASIHSPPLNYRLLCLLTQQTLPTVKLAVWRGVGDVSDKGH